VVSQPTPCELSAPLLNRWRWCSFKSICLFFRLKTPVCWFYKNAFEVDPSSPLRPRFALSYGRPFRVLFFQTSPFASLCIVAFPGGGLTQERGPYWILAPPKNLPLHSICFFYFDPSLSDTSLGSYLYIYNCPIHLAFDDPSVFHCCSLKYCGPLLVYSPRIFLYMVSLSARYVALCLLAWSRFSLPCTFPVTPRQFLGFSPLSADSIPRTLAYFFLIYYRSSSYRFPLF